VAIVANPVWIPRQKPALDAQLHFCGSSLHTSATIATTNGKNKRASGIPTHISAHTERGLSVVSDVIASGFHAD
jgi:hypothetical protein